MRYNNESEILKELEMDSWRNLSKDKFMKFVAMMPDMSDELRIKVIEQIPQYVELCKEWLNMAKEVFNKLMEKDKETATALINLVNNISDAISKILDKETISEEERKYLIDKQMELAKMLERLDERTKKWIENIWGTTLKALGYIVLGFIALLGGKFLFDSKE